MKRIGLATMLLVAFVAAALAGSEFDEWYAVSRGGKDSAAASVACSADGKTVYAADLRNIWKSENGGATWKKVTPKE
jgi:hypothetical protein